MPQMLLYFVFFILLVSGGSLSLIPKTNSCTHSLRLDYSLLKRILHTVSCLDF